MLTETILKNIRLYSITQIYCVCKGDTVYKLNEQEIKYSKPTLVDSPEVKVFSVYYNKFESSYRSVHSLVSGLERDGLFHVLREKLSKINLKGVLS